MFDVGPARDSGDADEIARLEADIALKRERASASLGELGQRLYQVTTWQRWIASHPIALIGAGALLGFIVGAAARRRRGVDW